MLGLNYLKLGSTLSNICNTTQLDNATKCYHAQKISGENPDLFISSTAHFSAQDELM